MVEREREREKEKEKERESETVTEGEIERERERESGTLTDNRTVSCLKVDDDAASRIQAGFRTMLERLETQGSLATRGDDTAVCYRVLVSTPGLVVHIVETLPFGLGPRTEVFGCECGYCG